MATAAERVRRYRDRQRRGAQVVSIDVDGLVIGALQCEEYLDDDTLSCICTDKAALVRAVQAHLRDWSEEVADGFETDQTVVADGPSAGAVPEAA